MRDRVTDFVNELQRKRIGDANQTYPEEWQKFSTSRAVEILVLFGFDQLRHCAEWFHPVSEVLFSPWRSSEDITAAMDAADRKTLFENGDGINVFAERVFSNVTFARLLRRHFASGECQFSVTLDVKGAAEAAARLSVYCNDSEAPERLIAFSPWWSNTGYLSLVRFANMLSIVVEESTRNTAAHVKKTRPIEDGNLASLLKELEYKI